MFAPVLTTALDALWFDAGAFDPQASVRHTMESSDAYLYGRCVFLVDAETCLVTNENMSSIETGLLMLSSRAWVKGL